MALMAEVGERESDRLFEAYHAKNVKSLWHALFWLVSHVRFDDEWKVDDERYASAMTSLLFHWGDRDFAAAVESMPSVDHWVEGLSAWRFGELFPQTWAALPGETRAWIWVHGARDKQPRRSDLPATVDHVFSLTLFDAVASSGDLTSFFKDHEGCWIGVWLPSCLCVTRTQGRRDRRTSSGWRAGKLNSGIDRHGGVGRLRRRER